MRGGQDPIILRWTILFYTFLWYHGKVGLNKALSVIRAAGSRLVLMEFLVLCNKEDLFTCGLTYVRIGLPVHSVMHGGTSVIAVTSETPTLANLLLGGLYRLARSRLSAFCSRFANTTFHILLNLLLIFTEKV